MPKVIYTMISMPGESLRIPDSDGPVEVIWQGLRVVFELAADDMPEDQ